MKKYLLVALMAFVIGCFSSSPKIIKDIINGSDSIKNSFESELVRIDNEIKSISQSYKVEARMENKVETKVNETTIIDNPQVMEARLGDTFGCTPKKSEQSKGEVTRKIEPLISVPQKPVVQTPIVPVVKVTPKSAKSAIISVKKEWSLVDGRMMFTKWNVKLNKTALDKVKLGAKVRIFIDYCYYESDKIEKDGTVSFNIEWHPPLAPTKGKIGVSLFMQLNTPEIGSGIQYCSTIIKI